MVRKLLLVVLAILVVVAMTACGCEHEEVVDVSVPATCTSSGLTEGKHCAKCNEVLVAQEVIPATGHSEQVIAAVEAGCVVSGSTEGKECALCGEILVAPESVPSLGHTTATGTCSRCGTSFGLFEIGYYVDEFNQPTSDGYVATANYIFGEFSNSATTDSELLVTILADGEDISFFLYEYGRNQVKNSSSRYVDDYDITMKTSDGTRHNITGTVYCGGDRLMIDSRHISTVLEALKSGENVSFYIVQSEYTTTTYLFTVNSSNFAEKYAELFG